MGAWIETYGGRIMTPMEIVAPYVGAWIETSVVDFIVMVIMGRTLCGCVD